ncbi:hypothetical protein G7046_g4137 [Stylonectria norvegica]|nr:hypothetical protein G7046_g4137 [Stylonectria norvegica]
MSTEGKTEVPTSSLEQITSSNFEDDAHDRRLQSRFRLLHMLDNGRLALTVLALVAAITILGVSADSIAVYNATHVPDDFFLALWPANFNLRPTVALVVGSVFIIVANAISLLGSKTQSVSLHHYFAIFLELQCKSATVRLTIEKIRNRAGLHTSITFAAPAIAFIAAIIAMSFFYAVNASTTADSFQSWTCRWRDVAMTTKPHFGTLCKESKAGVGLSVFLVPLEAIILGVAGYQAVLERQLDTASQGSRRKAGSPAMS